ncbi:MAG: cysteine-rich CWC family protein [Bacteroides sp.]|nr:cysteine-rich CWC family protein [Bacteroides sp.]MCM1085767.1 cysteine-rich CWC family protein [Bacteroides sp.]
MQKTCPNCGNRFECLHEDILHCQCAKVRIDAPLRAYLQEHYGDKCLCASCLQKLWEETRKKA